MTLLDYCKEQLEAELERLTRTLAEIRLRNEEQFRLIDQLEKEQQVLQLSVDEKTKQVAESQQQEASSATLDVNLLWSDTTTPEGVGNENSISALLFSMNHNSSSGSNSGNRQERSSPRKAVESSQNDSSNHERYRQLQRNISLMEDILNRSLMKEENVSNAWGGDTAQPPSANNATNHDSFSSLLSQHTTTADEDGGAGDGVDDDYMSWFDKASAAAAATSEAPLTPQQRTPTATLRDSMKSLTEAALLMPSPRLNKKESPTQTTTTTTTSTPTSRSSSSSSFPSAPVWKNHRPNQQDDDRSIGSRDATPFSFRRGSTSSNASTGSRKSTSSTASNRSSSRPKTSSELGSKLEWIKRQQEPAEPLQVKMERLQQRRDKNNNGGGGDDRSEPGHPWYQDVTERSTRSVPNLAMNTTTTSSNMNSISLGVLGQVGGGNNNNTNSSSKSKSNKRGGRQTTPTTNTPHPLESLLLIASSDGGSSDTMSQSSSHSTNSSSKRGSNNGGGGGGGLLTSSRRKSDSSSSKTKNASFADRIQKELLLKQGFSEEELQLNQFNASFNSLPNFESPKQAKRSTINIFGDHLTTNPNPNHSSWSNALDFDVNFVTAKAVVAGAAKKSSSSKSKEPKKEHSLSRALRLEAATAKQISPMTSQRGSGMAVAKHSSFKSPSPNPTKRLFAAASPESPRDLAMGRSQSLKWLNSNGGSGISGISSNAGNGSSSSSIGRSGSTSNLQRLASASPSSTSSSHHGRARPVMPERSPSASSFGSSSNKSRRRKSQRLPFPEAPIF